MSGCHRAAWLQPQALSTERYRGLRPPGRSLGVRPLSPFGRVTSADLGPVGGGLAELPTPGLM